MSAGMLLYAYGVVPTEGARPPASLRGLDDEGVRVVESGDLAAIVSEVTSATYGEEALEAQMADVAWVGARGVAHERVLTWFGDRGPVVPFSPFSLHRDEDALRARLDERRDALRAALERVRGRREWGIRVWRDESRFAEHLDTASESLRQLATEIESASSGRRFLLNRKMAALRDEEARRLSHQAARAIYAQLSEHADESRALPLPAVAGRTRSLSLHAAFLVSEDGYPTFERAVQELAAKYTAAGFDWEFTGPWPPYHFTSGDAT
jgi:hypothetical protein